MIQIEDVLKRIDEHARGFQFQGDIEGREISYIIDMEGRPFMTIKGKKGECEIQPAYYKTKSKDSKVLVLEKVSGFVKVETYSGIKREIKGKEAESTSDCPEIIIPTSMDKKDVEDMTIYSSSMGLFEKYATNKKIQKALSDYKNTKDLPTIDDFLD